MVCLITGSSRGLGKACALAFGSRGHQVAVHYRKNREAAAEVASRIKGSMIVKADVREYDEVRNLVDEVIRTWGRIDVLVNNAGITREALLIKTTEKDFDQVLATNLKGPFYIIRSIGRYMMKQKGGHIINVSSFAGIKGKEGLSAYSASKAGLIGLGKTAARELVRYGIMVNTVLPGYMLTDMGKASCSRAQHAALSNSLTKEFSDPAAVAEFICNLSETAGITGQVFNLDSRIV